jgi:hypothetical protein
LATFVTSFINHSCVEVLGLEPAREKTHKLNDFSDYSRSVHAAFNKHHRLSGVLVIFAVMPWHDGKMVRF